MTDVATPDAVAAVRARLALGREGLRDRPREQTVDSLAASFERWRDPRSPWRRRLEEQLADAAGFHLATVRAGLACGLAGFTSEAFRQLLRRELAIAGSDTEVTGFEQTSVLLAGSIPMPTLLSLTLPLALHSPVLARPASRDPVTPALFAACLAEIDPELARCLEIVSFPNDDEACLAAFLDSPCVLATGSDDTVAAISARVAPTTRLVAFGHRLSIVAIGSRELSEAELGELAAQLALDIVLWDQLGCLSPVAIYFEASRDRADRLAEELARALRASEESLPRGDADVTVAGAIRREREEALLRRAAGQDVVIHSDAGTRWTVIRECDTQWRPAPLHRFIRIHPAQDQDSLLAAIAPLGPHLAAVALAGFGEATAQLTRRFAELGASRVCAPGTLQSPPLGWHHDNRPLLLPLSRLCDGESSSTGC